MRTSSKETVQLFIQSLNNEDFTSARSYLADEMVFDGVLGSRNGADTYMQDMHKMKFKYQVKKAFEDGNDVCLLYDIDMGSGQNIFTCGWYRVEKGKIKSLKVVFDPRPLLDGK
jgi:hypothetical protein